MTREQKKNYLKRYIASKDAIKCIREEIAFLYDMATHITPNLSPTPGGGGSDKIQNAVDRIDGAESKLERAAASLEATCGEILELINSLEEPSHLAIMYRRYIQGKRFATICRETHYELSTVMGLHRDALDSLDM